MKDKLAIRGWNIELVGDKYLHIFHDDHPGDIQIKADDEGYAVDIFGDGEVTSQAGTWALYDDLKEEAAEEGTEPTPNQGTIVEKVKDALERIASADRGEYGFDNDLMISELQSIAQDAAMEIDGWEFNDKHVTK